MASSLGAAEIIAWKAPLSNLAYDGVEAREVVRLENAPEKSPFFGKDDELWDVHETLPENAASAEWAVWNATTRRIVVKGSWTAIREVERLIQSPSQCRITVDTYRVAGDGSPPDFSKRPDMSAGGVCRSGMKYSFSSVGGGASLRFEGVPVLSENDGIIDLTLLISTSLCRSPDLEINTAVTFEDGASVWLARTFDGKGGTDIRITGTIELSDGSPYAEKTLRQVGDSIVPFGADRSEPQRRAIEGGGWLASARMPSDQLGLISGEDPDPEADPFADAATGRNETPLKEFPTNEAPVKLEPYFGGPVLDLKKEIRMMGIIIGESDFVGYDMATQRIFMYSTDEAEIDKFEAVFVLSWVDGGSPATLAISARGNGQMRLLGRSGQRMILKSALKETKRARLLEFEPTIGENGTLVDLRVLFEEKSDGMLLTSINSSATLDVGTYLELLKTRLPDGSESAMEFKAEILRSP